MMDDFFDKCMGYQIESKLVKMNEDLYRLEPKIDSLISILKEKIINKKDELKYTRAEFVHKNFSWGNVVEKLIKEFEIRLNQ